jgi:hypothetical protein
MTQRPCGLAKLDNARIRSRDSMSPLKPFQEFPSPVEKSDPHSGVVGKDGRAWFTLTTPGLKIVSVDPETNKIKLYTNPEDKGASHTMIMDKEGNLWISGHGTDSAVQPRCGPSMCRQSSSRPTRFPAQPNIPRIQKAAGKITESKPVRYGTYHLGFDSKGHPLDEHSRSRHNFSARSRDW